MDLLEETTIETTIELDCPPAGDPKPFDLIKGLVKGLHIQISYDVRSSIFGNYTWDVVYPNEQALEEVAERIRKPWAREFQIADPDGHVLRFGGEPSEE